MPAAWVTKFDGTVEPFERQKIVNTCLRMGASQENAQAIADSIEQKIYKGIHTRKILQMIFSRLKRHRPAVRHQIDLRRAISLLRPKPDFERFVHLLLREYGYSVTPNCVIRGRCVEHEIDAVAQRGKETVLVEIKHHIRYHTRTSLDVCRVARASIEDLKEGYDLGLNTVNFSKALIVCNTKFSEHARQYAECRGIGHIGWRAPPDHGLERMIEDKRMYPITYLKTLRRESRDRILDCGMVLLRQLTAHNVKELQKSTKIRKAELEQLIKKAQEILSDDSS